MANSGAGPPASPGAFLQLCTAESQNAFLKAVSEGAQAITRRLLENQQATAAEYGSAAATLHRFRRAADEAVAEAMRREIGTLLASSVPAPPSLARAFVAAPRAPKASANAASTASAPNAPSFASAATASAATAFLSAAAAARSYTFRDFALSVLFLTPLPPLLPSLAADSLVNGMLPVLVLLPVLVRR